MAESKKINHFSPKYALTQMRKSLVSYAFVLPFMSVFFVFVLLPVIISIFISLTSFDMLRPPKFIGVENYLNLFLRDSVFLKSIGITTVLAAIVGPVSYILSFTMAWLINEFPPKLRALITLILYAPAISGNVYMIWTILFSGDDYGYLNGILLKLGLIPQSVQWLKDTKYMMLIVIVVALWSSLGTSFLAFIAGLQGVDRSLYEAGMVDGVKNRWQEMFFITLPSMKPQLLFGAVMAITSSFGIGGICTALCGFPSTDYAVHTIMNHLEDYGGMRYEMGYASAIATILFVIMLLCNFAIQKLLSKVGE